MKRILFVLLIAPAFCSAMDDGTWVPVTDMTQSSNESYPCNQSSDWSTDQTISGTSDSPSYDNPCPGADVVDRN